MKAGLICLLTIVNLMSSCINRDKSFDGESFLVGTGACTVIHSDTLTCNCDLKGDTVYMRTLKATYPMGTELVTTMAINSTDTPLEYGCDWWLYKWTVNKWEKAVPQRDISFAGCIVTPS